MAMPEKTTAAPVQRRTTKQRQLVLDIVRRGHEHPTAEEVFASARACNPRISRATVYRNLALLTEEGSLLSVNVGGVSRFDDASEPHGHLICTCCGRVDDVPLEPGDLQACMDRAQRDSCFELTGAQLMLYGICPNCQNAGADRPNTQAVNTKL